MVHRRATNTNPFLEFSGNLSNRFHHLLLCLLPLQSFNALAQRSGDRRRQLLSGQFGKPASQLICFRILDPKDGGQPFV